MMSLTAAAQYEYSYDDNNYYIETNKKKLAHDNLAVVGGIDKASGAFDDVPYGIVEGVSGVKVLVGKVQKFTIHSCFISGRSNRWPPAQGGYHMTKLQNELSPSMLVFYLLYVLDKLASL